MKYTALDATISECGTYRYTLSRWWADPLLTNEPYCLFMMLNPSTADAAKDDPTIRRCVAFADKWGFRRLQVCNLFAFRATDPRDLYKAADPVGPSNVSMVAVQALNASLIVCAWGAHGGFQGAGKLFADGCRNNKVKVHHLGLTASGQPKHPLYLPNDTTPTLWTP